MTCFDSTLAAATVRVPVCLSHADSNDTDMLFNIHLKQAVIMCTFSSVVTEQIDCYL